MQDLNALDVKKQLKTLAKETSAWHEKCVSVGAVDPYDIGPIIKLPYIVIGKEFLDYDNTGSIDTFLWIQYFDGVFDVYETTYISADIYSTLDQMYESIICSTQSRQKVLRLCKDRYKKLKQTPIM